MFFSKAAGVLSALSVLASAIPVQDKRDALVEEATAKVFERQSGFTATTGVRTGGVQPRLEIRQLAADPDLFNIYLLGLLRFQYAPQTDKLSWYQIAGIHGRPYTTWDGVNPTANSQTGYCTHVSNLFPTWHRPYLALFEQVLYQHVQDAVAEFPAGDLKNRYLARAATFRAPYWDWALMPSNGQSKWPSFMQQQYITITVPWGGTQSAPNPLYSYLFHPAPGNDFPFYPFNVWEETKRAPNSQNANAVSQNNIIASNLDNAGTQFRDRLYNLFTYYYDYMTFSNEAWIGDQGYDSIESLHDTIHVLTGSDGHMAIVDFAAFDPVFWLHHNMIDRAFALWEGVYRNSYVQPQNQAMATYNIQGTADVNTGLTPFRGTNGQFWTSAQVRSTTTFGYTYPELQNNPSVAQVRQTINRLYGTTATGSSNRKRGIFHDSAAFNNAAKNATAATGRTKSYQVNVQVQKHGVGSSFTVYVFLGDYNKDPKTYAADPNLVGQHSVLATKAGMGNALAVSGVIPLTTTLTEKVADGILDCVTDEDAVAKYLKKNIHWEVTKIDGTVVDADSVPDLKVSVQTYEIIPAANDDEFPTRTNPKLLTKVTEGKKGGISRRDVEAMMQ